MSWIWLSILSALFLGLYEIAKKSAVRGNAVPPVLLLSTSTAAILWLPWIVLSQVAPDAIPNEAFRVTTLGLHEHLYLFCKSVLAGTSWIFAFFALKHLPLSIASPIRATSPLWTIAIATLWMGERPSVQQWIGVAIVLAAFYAFSFVGLREGIRFDRNRWVGCMVVATLLGALSALYDKYLLQRVGFDPSTVQAWFSIYLVAVMTPLCLYWWFRERTKSPFHWRWQIPAIAIGLLIADFLYFTAIAQPDALISVISPLRRSSILIAFAAGILMFGEVNWRAKAVCIGGLLAGVFLLSW
ncbi:EamA family transporter [Rosistilla oblonga]|uniref:EamA family transporter n=1 Tax=Rosistilla oblonga TaxID=2527990 RepID=UPI003A98028E